MSTQITHLEMTRSAAPGMTAPGALGDDLLLRDGPLMAARGIVVAVVLVTPFWIVFAFMLYMLV